MPTTRSGPVLHRGLRRTTEPFKISSGKADAQGLQQFCWDIATIETHLDEIRSFWASRLGVSVPQWMILAALEDMDAGEGVAVKDVSAKMFVDPSFVTTQSKMLEGKGFIRRANSPHDARVILMSITDDAKKRMSLVNERRDSIQKFIFSDFDSDALENFLEQVSAVKAKCERAARILAAD